MTDSLLLAASLILASGASFAAAQDAAQTNAVVQPGGALPGAASAPASAPVAPPAGHTVIHTKAKFHGKLTPDSPPPKTTLFDYQKELDLTDAQLAKMKDMVKTLEAKFRDEKQAGEQDTAEVRRLLQANADVKDIRAKLQDLANLEVEHQIAEIETSREVGKILSPEQQEKWRAIQTRLAQRASAAPRP